MTPIKSIKCPQCNRLLAVQQRNDLNGQPCLHVRHRGMELFTESAVIVCAGCKLAFGVDGASGIIEEISHGNTATA